MKELVKIETTIDKNNEEIITIISVDVGTNDAEIIELFVNKFYNGAEAIDAKDAFFEKSIWSKVDICILERNFQLEIIEL